MTAKIFDDRPYSFYTADFPEDMALKLFRKRFGCEPARNFIEGEYRKLGPEPARRVIIAAPKWKAGQ